MLAMNKHFCLSLILLFAVPIKNFAQNDSIQIRQSFDDLQYALLQENGSDAIHLIDKNTFNFYSALLFKAKTYDSTLVEKLNIYEKAFLFSVRLRDAKDDVKSMDDSSFIKYATDQGMIDKMGLTIGGATLGNIKISADSATSQLMLLNTVSLAQLKFRKYGNKWRVDLSSLIPMSNLAMKHMVIQRKQTDTEFLLSVIRENESLDQQALWRPLIK